MKINGRKTKLQSGDMVSVEPCDGHVLISFNRPGKNQKSMGGYLRDSITGDRKFLCYAGIDNRAYSVIKVIAETNGLKFKKIDSKLAPPGKILYEFV